MASTGSVIVGRAGGSLFERFVLFGPFVAQGDWWRLFTSMFLHWSVIHIGSNMLVLFFIGPALESVLGRWRFLTLYLVSGIAGSASVMLFWPSA